MSNKTNIIMLIAVALFIIGLILNYMSIINIPVFKGGLFDRAAYNAGVTANYLRHKKSITKDYLHDIKLVTRELSSRRNKLLEEVNVDYDRLRRTDAYYNLSLATLYVADNLGEYSSVYQKIKTSLKLLNENRTDDALTIYVMIRGSVFKLIDIFNKSLTILEQTDTRYYPDKHMEKYIYLKDEVRKALNLLIEYRRLMEYLLRNANYIRAMRGTYGETAYVTIGESLMKNIDLSKFGELSGDVSDLLTSMASNQGNNNTRGYGGSPEQNSGSKNRAGGGTGGGPGGPSSDD